MYPFVFQLLYSYLSCVKIGLDKHLGKFTDPPPKICVFRKHFDLSALSPRQLHLTVKRTGLEPL